MKISQIRAIHRACHRRDLAAMEEYIQSTGKMWGYRHSEYKTMRMYLRHGHGIECRDGKLYRTENITRCTLVWSPEAQEWEIEEVGTCRK